MQTRKLYRSQTNKMIAGVCGGIAEYFGFDPTLVRLAFVLACLTPLHGVLIYLILWIITPVAPYPTDVTPTPTA
jgi:phage shock protein C